MKGTNRAAILSAMAAGIARMQALAGQTLAASAPIAVATYRRTSHNTVAQHKRAAKKRRNQLRAKAQQPTKKAKPAGRGWAGMYARRRQ